MSHDIFNLGGEPSIRLDSCEGDLKIQGGHEEHIRIEGEYEYQQEQGTLIIRGHDDLRLWVPAGTRCTAGSVDGDAQITQIAEFDGDTISGDLMARHLGTLRVAAIHGDARLEQIDTFQGTVIDGDVQVLGSQSARLQSIEGDLTVNDTSVFQAGSVQGDLHAVTVASLRIEQVEGDASLRDCQDAAVLRVGGDCKLANHRGAFTCNSVGGDATLQGMLTGLEPLRVGGDFKLNVDWQAGATYHATVGGDATLYVPDAANLVLSATVGGAASGLPAQSSASSATWGDIEQAARVELTVGGDLSVRGTRPAGEGHGWGAGWSSGSWSGSGWQQAINEIVDELTTMGRDIASHFTSINWAQQSEEKAEQARRAAERATDRVTRAAERMSVRINDREFRFDPERLERIREQARRAADEGISRAQEAVEQAMRGFERTISGIARPPASPTAPDAPAPPAPPAPPRSPQRLRVSEDDGTGTAGMAAATGPTVSLRPEDAPAAPAAEQPADRTTERLAILKMVETGKISADEAALLLEALR